MPHVSVSTVVVNAVDVRELSPFKLFVERVIMTARHRANVSTPTKPCRHPCPKDHAVHAGYCTSVKYTFTIIL